MRWDPALSSCFRGPVLFLLRAKGAFPSRAHPATSAHALGTWDFRVPYLDYAELPSKNGIWALSPALSLARHPQECASLGLRPGQRAAVYVVCGPRFVCSLGCPYLCPWDLSWGRTEPGVEQKGLGPGALKSAEKVRLALGNQECFWCINSFFSNHHNFQCTLYYFCISRWIKWKLKRLNT